MGCLVSRKELCIEERTLISMEEQLEYSKIHVKTVESVIRKHSSEYKITLRQWSLIGEELQIKIRNNRQCPQATEFYCSYLENECFWMKDILILAILLSDGAIRTKAKLLFNVFDTKNEGFLDKKVFAGLFDDLEKCTLKKIPLLVSNTTYPAASKSQIFYYISTLLFKIPQAKAAFIEIITGGRGKISSKQFQDVFDITENALLLSTFGFRHFLAKA